jgi:TolB protein
VVRGGAREYEVEFRLFDTFTAAQLAGQRYSRVRPDQLRWVAHQISDGIYYALTGERGAFATRIAYVTETAGQEGEVAYALNVADSDGGNPVVLRTSPEPIMSPAWSPDGRWLAYVSFEGGRSGILLQELATGLRRKVTDFAGINGAPAFSPDGRRLALTLSREGSPDIHVLNLESGELRRLTTSPDIDTEPAWSPDGRDIVFTSDRSGARPQLFRISASGASTPERLTFSGRYNARAVFSPDGSRLAFVHESDGDYRIAVMGIGDGNIDVLTNGRLDESPTFAPNGRLILYATTERGRSALASVSIDGRFRQRLSIDETGVRDPAWSPTLSRR